MNSKGHLYVSLVKSFLRILGLTAFHVTGIVGWFIVLFCVAELLGIVEELVDWR